MAEKIQKGESLKYVLLGISIIIITFGIMFVLTAAEVVIVFNSIANIGNILGRYIIVILTMSIGIMLFSNVAITLKNNKLRNGLTIGITVFSTILTIPLVYVFVAIFWAQNGIMGPVGEAMKVDSIADGFNAWFGTGAFIYVLYAILLVVSIVFIAFPLITGTLAVKGKALKIGKQTNGKFGIGTQKLPILQKMKDG